MLDTVFLKDTVLNIDTVKEIVYVLNEPSYWGEVLPNWIQAIVSILALAGVVYSFVTLKNQIKGQNDQIGALTEQALATNKLVEFTKESLNLERTKSNARVKPEIKIQPSSINTMQEQSFVIVNTGKDYAEQIEVRIELKDDNNEESITISGYEELTDILHNDGKDSIFFSITKKQHTMKDRILGSIYVDYFDIHDNNFLAEFLIMTKNNSILIEKLIVEEIK